MNIFYLSKDPIECAQRHCDKHVVKMIIEYAQLMSTAHRVLDGEMYIGKTANNRKIKRWQHYDAVMEETLYKASHINHPSTIWTRDSLNNYNWLYKMWVSLGEEYTYRYGKQHATISKLKEVLQYPPDNIGSTSFKQPTQAMPDDCKHESSLIAYTNYYKLHKTHIAKWTKRKMPNFYLNFLRKQNFEKYGNITKGLTLVQGKIV